MRLGDLAPEGLALSIQLPLLVQANLSLDRLHCAALDSGLQRPRLLPSPHCKLDLAGGGLAGCNCSVTGTFGILLSRAAGKERSAVDWPPTTLVYGTTAGLVLALLALAALLRAHFLLPRSPDSLLKLLSCGSLSVFFVLLLLAAEKMVPHQAEEVVQVEVIFLLHSNMSPC